ncbi:hypothetical protein DVA86_16180 [Streptomyces armeniacus]|uniref:Uncharacterized protein n=1 Tax=Streptomyces armeniacus TaxID=83291 RepID=A0A345Y0F6_9ACTN|nr:hypothetical protein DVA86_16180 [Streptomyces armeniacus]
MRHTIHIKDGSQPQSRVFAYVERELPPGGIPAYRAARKAGARSFVLWADERREQQLARLVTQSAHGGRTTYQVLDAHGQITGTITRRNAFRGGGLRTRWTVAQPGGPEAVGYKGRLFWWLVCWLMSPLLPLFLIGALFENGDLPRAPRRVTWRAGGRTVMVHKPSSEAVLLHPPEPDPRVGAALAALLLSFKGWYGTSWDDRKE